MSLCSYNVHVNPAVALSGPWGVVPSNDWHMSRGLLHLNRSYFPVSATLKTRSPDA